MQVSDELWSGSVDDQSGPYAFSDSLCISDYFYLRSRAFLQIDYSLLLIVTDSRVGWSVSETLSRHSRSACPAPTWQQQ